MGLEKSNRLSACKPPQTALKCILDVFMLAVDSDQLIGERLCCWWALKINAFVTQSARSSVGEKSEKK
jgi:hypothetical protein